MANPQSYVKAAKFDGSIYRRRIEWNGLASLLTQSERMKVETGEKNPNEFQTISCPYVSQVAVGKLEQVQKCLGTIRKMELVVRDSHVIDLTKGHVAALKKNPKVQA